MLRKVCSKNNPEPIQARAFHIDSRTTILAGTVRVEKRVTALNRRSRPGAVRFHDSAQKRQLQSERAWSEAAKASTFLVKEDVKTGTDHSGRAC